jgi:hypothetical protein
VRWGSHSCEEDAFTVGKGRPGRRVVHLTFFMVEPCIDMVISLQPWERVGCTGMVEGTEVWMAKPSLLPTDGVGCAGMLMAMLVAMLVAMDVWLVKPSLLPADGNTVMVSVTLVLAVTVVVKQAVLELTGPSAEENAVLPRATLASAKAAIRELKIAIEDISDCKRVW